MDFPWHILIINVVVIFLVAGIMAAWIGEREKAVVFINTLIVAFALSWGGWVIYIGLHFISKYW